MYIYKSFSMCINLMPFETDSIATIFCRFNIEQWEFKARTRSLLKNGKFKMGKKIRSFFMANIGMDAMYGR